MRARPRPSPAPKPTSPSTGIRTAAGPRLGSCRRRMCWRSSGSRWILALRWSSSPSASTGTTQLSPSRRSTRCRSATALTLATGRSSSVRARATAASTRSRCRPGATAGMCVWTAWSQGAALRHRHRHRQRERWLWENSTMIATYRETHAHCWHLGCILPRVPAMIVRTGRPTPSAKSSASSRRSPKTLTVGQHSTCLSSGAALLGRFVQPFR